MVQPALLPPLVHWAGLNHHKRVIEGTSLKSGTAWDALSLTWVRECRRIVKRKNGEDWELGSGNFGKVMRGIRGDVQPVAIKSTFKRDRQMEDAFIREIAMMK